MATPTSSWAVLEGRALWNGEPLSYWANVLAADLAVEFGPEEIWLFGSVARGDDTGDSDLDLLVVLDSYDPTTAIELKQRALRATEAPAPFDVAFTDVNRLATLQQIAGTLERAVLLDGRCLYRRG